MKKRDISRRNFLKGLGLGTAAVATSTLMGCDAKSEREKESEGKMEYRINPRTQEKVSLLGYGCMRFPHLNTPAADGNIVDQEIANRLVDYALEHGVNYFDTAPVYAYGWSEQTVGNALSRHPRDSYFVATKLSDMKEPTFENSLKMYHNSMEKLKVDYIDYYLLHSVGGGSDPFAKLKGRFFDNGVLDFLLKEREAGRIRNLGFSFHGDVRIFDYLLSLHGKIHWDFVQIQLNYSDWDYPGNRNVKAKFLMEKLKKLDIPVVVMEPLLGGRLSKLPQNLVAKVMERDPEHSVASWAFRFAGSYPNVLTVLSGMTCIEHLEENIETYSNFQPLTNEEVDFLLQVAVMLKKYPLIQCNDCKYCMPCPYGLDIPAILLYYNKCVNQGYIAHDAGDKNYLKARRIFLSGYDRDIPKERQAEHCIGCQECMPKCPQSKLIDIPAEMQRIDKYVAALRRGVVLLSELRDALHNKQCSLVVSSPGVSYDIFTGQGVSDLYKLVTEDRVRLKNACVADKVVGKGAAILMVAGEVREVYTDLISSPGLDYLKANGVRVQYGKLTDQIMNREGKDLCPVEKICQENDDPEKCISLIGEFLRSKNLV